MIRTKYPNGTALVARANAIREIIDSPISGEAEKCRRSFYYFMKTYWDTVNSNEPKWNWHIKYLCDQLQELAERVAKGLPKKNDIIINIPPGTTKSMTCTIMFPVWCWTRWYWMRFIAASYSADLSLEHADYSREIVRSEKYRKMFPEIELKRDKDKKSNFRLVYHAPDGTTKLGGSRFSTSVGGMLTGMHGHILIVDDPLNPEKAASEVEIKNANRWIDGTLSTRKIEKTVTPTVLIMQRLHQNDPAGHIMDKGKKNIFHICLPGEIKNYKDKVQPPHLVNNYIDNLLDPVRMPWEVMTDMELDLGQYGYAGQVGQNPVPPGGGMFSIDRFHIIDQFPASEIVESVRYWDKAGSTPEEQNSAYTVGVLMHKLKSGRVLISDCKRGMWRSEVREDIIRSAAEVDGCRVIIYHEQEPGSGGKESSEATTLNLAGFRAHADRPTGDKIYRADSYSVQVNHGNVLLMRGEWNAEFLKEHEYFPFSTTKDQVDASSGAFNKLVGKKAVKTL